MPAKYKFTYFNIKARGELPRLVMAAAGQEWEDVRIEFSDWPALKPTMPFGQLPVFESDGKTYFQSRAISRMLARRHGLAGANEDEQVRADMLVDSCEDMALPVINYTFNAQNDEHRATMKKKADNETVPAQLANLEKLLCSNNGGDQWFVGDKMTWADLAVFHYVDFLQALGKFQLDFSAAPKVKAHAARVAAVPNVAAWLKKRPVTDA